MTGTVTDDNMISCRCIMQNGRKEKPKKCIPWELPSAKKRENTRSKLLPVTCTTPQGLVIRNFLKHNLQENAIYSHSAI